MEVHEGPFEFRDPKCECDGPSMRSCPIHHGNGGMGSLREFFSDPELVAFVRATYTDAMAGRVEAMLAADPASVTGFVTALRRSLTAEMDRSIRRA